MSKIIDITDKLHFEEKPQIKIKDTVITINDSAMSLLEAIPLLQNSADIPENLNKICDLLFNETEREKIKALDLNFKDFMVFLQKTIESVTDGKNEQGEIVTPATI